MKKFVFLSFLSFLFLNLVGCSKEATITFIQENEEDIVFVINKGESLSSIPVPKAVYGYDTEWSVSDFSLIKKSIEVYAISTPKEYSITYHLNGGMNNKLNPKTYTIEDCPFEIVYPATKKGIDFIGWYYGADVDSQKVSSIDSDNLEDVEVYAIYIEETEGLSYILENGNTTYTVIGYSGTSENVFIPKFKGDVPVTKIGPGAFNHNSNVKKIFVGSNVTSMGVSAFYICDNLEEVKFFGEITNIGETAFLLCEKLTSVIMPDTVTSIGNAAFSQCGELKELRLPSGLKQMGSAVFFNATSLEKLYLPMGITSMGTDVFLGCVNLTVYVKEDAKPASWPVSWCNDARIVYGYSE